MNKFNEPDNSPNSATGNGPSASRVTHGPGSAQGAEVSDLEPGFAINLKSEPNLTLAEFLIKLAVDEKFRERYHQDAATVIENNKPALSQDAKLALRSTEAADVWEALGINNQNSSIAISLGFRVP